MKIVAKKGNCLLEYEEDTNRTDYPRAITKDRYSGTKTKSERTFELISHVCNELKGISDDTI